MMGKTFRWMRSNRWKTLVSVLFVLFLLLNVLAFFHAWAMTHFAPEGSGRVGKPESLSTLGKVNVLFMGATIPKPSAPGVSPADVGLPFETRHLEGNGDIELEAWYLPCHGSRGLVLMFHGYGACKAALLPEALALHELGYALFLVDFRGSGGSSGQVTTIGVKEAEDVSLVMDYARAHWSDQPVILYGQSMGSVAILRAIAKLGVRPQAVVVECPFDRLLTTVANRFASMGLPAFPGVQLLVFWGGVQHGFDGFAHNPIDYAREVECPVLQLHGDLDRRVTTEQARTVFSALAGPKEFELFEDAGHESYLVRQTEKWRTALGRFLKDHVKSGGPAEREYGP